MFKSARQKLTVIYCLIFFSVFWLFSAGLYVWMDHSFGEGYISKVKNQQVEQVSDAAFDTKSAQTVTIAGDVALGQLKRVLIILNGIMILAVPGLAWALTGRTLRPIEETYNKQKRFVSDASHELRTPLTIMQGELDIALKKLRSPQEYQAALRSTREEVGRLHSLAESLLFVVRADRSRSDALTDSIDVIDVLTEVTSRLQSLATAKRVNLTFTPPNAILSVKGSSATLKQLFTNLVENAIKFTPNKGSVTVSTEPSKHGISIFVTDTGIGMSSDEQEQAFGRFYRADTARHQAGFGLGLAICQTIVREHRGSISLTSKPGKGTTVTVLLPRA